MQSDDILKAELKQAVSECERLRDENARLRLRLGETSDIRAPRAEQLSANIKKSHPSETVTASSPPELKVALFRSLFRGRDDVYAVRWEGKSGKTGYSPAGIREWERPSTTKSGQKNQFRLSKLFPLTEEVVRDHLLGKQTIGVYPLL